MLRGFLVLSLTLVVVSFLARRSLGSNQEQSSDTHNTTSDTSVPCVQCEKMLPICRCRSDEECIITSQTCQECARAVCRPHSS